jgi:hypothetical protein
MSGRTTDDNSDDPHDERRGGASGSGNGQRSATSLTTRLKTSSTRCSCSPTRTIRSRRRAALATPTTTQAPALAPAPAAAAASHWRQHRLNQWQWNALLRCAAVTPRLGNCSSRQSHWTRRRDVAVTHAHSICCAKWLMLSQFEKIFHVRIEFYNFLFKKF